MTVNDRLLLDLDPNSDNFDALLTLKPYYGILPFNHPTTLAPYPCLQCRRRCFTIQDLDLHARWHRRENECSLCRKTFASFEIFVSHVRKHYVDATKNYSVNNKIRDIPATCSFCHEDFSNVRDLHRHVQLFADSYVDCKECDTFLPSCHNHTHREAINQDINQDTFKKHKMKALTELRKDMTLHEDNQLKIQNRIKNFAYQIKPESQLKPFRCEMCMNRFGDRDTLQSHLNQHFSEHALLYKAQPSFPSTSRLKLRGGGNDSFSYGLMF